MVNERGANRLFPAHGFSATAPISPVCGALWWQLKIKASLVWISSSAWPLHSLPSGKVFATSTCLRAQQPKLYHMGFGVHFSQQPRLRQEHRDWRNLRRFRADSDCHGRDLYHDEPFGVELSETVYALDSTTIDLCLSLFPWEIPSSQECRETAHAVGSARQIPTNVIVTGGQVHDVTFWTNCFPKRSVLLARSVIGLCSLYFFTQACASSLLAQKE